ncbi:MAG: hypothetical protein ACLP52_07985 [Streptosporangiaceae bacterium]
MAGHGNEAPDRPPQDNAETGRSDGVTGHVDQVTVTARPAARRLLGHD